MAIVRPTVLNINKPLGWTSRDVLNFLQSTYNFKKFGHAGTLDPLATGVLIVLVANKTKLQDYYLGLNKSYNAKIFFNVDSPTLDLEGPFKVNKCSKSITSSEIVKFIESKVGVNKQMVPFFSSVKVGGKELYKHVRGGQTKVKRPTKEVNLISFKINNFVNNKLPANFKQIEKTKQINPRDDIDLKTYKQTLNYLTKNTAYVDITLNTGKGYYVRALARDLGKHFGGGAVLGSLQRQSVGSFSVKDAKTIQYFKQKPDLL